MKQFLNLLLGGIEPLQFVVLYFWGLLGAFITIMVHLTSRNAKSYRSPVNFSWSFFIRDNLPRLVLNLVLIAVFIRFSPDLLHHAPSDIVALGVGLGFDLLGVLITELSPIKLSGIVAQKAAPGASPDPAAIAQLKPEGAQ